MVDYAMIMPWWIELIEFGYQWSKHTESYLSGDMNIIQIGPQTLDTQWFENDSISQFQ